MRTYAELQDLGRNLSASEVEALIQSLSTDDRFAAVAAVLDRAERSWATTLGHPNLVNQSANRAMHAAGGIHAVQRLAAGFSRILAPITTSGGMEPPEGETVP